MAKLAILMAFILSASAMAANAEKPFSITVQGLKIDIAYIKKRSELKMARNVDFCRGPFMPAKIEEWKCEDLSKQVQKCYAKYTCKRITKSFSRISETRRLRNALRSIGRGKGKFKIWISKRPVHNVDRYKTGPMPGYTTIEEEADIEKKEEEARKALELENKQKRKEEIEVREIDEDILDQKLKEIKKEDPKNIKEELELEGDVLNLEEEEKEVSKAQSINKKKSLAYHREKFLTPLSFATGFTSVNDDEANSVTSLHFAWTPSARITRAISLKAQLGMSAGQNSLSANESFTSVETAFFVIGKMGNLFLEYGIGRQTWGNDSGDSFNESVLGVGFELNKKLFNLVDKIFIQRVAVSNSINTSEFRISLGLMPF